MASSKLELQAAIVTALRADADFAALAGSRIYDKIPERPDYPYAAFGPTITTPMRLQGSRGHEIGIQIDVQDRPERAGSTRAQALMDAIEAVLDDTEFVLASHEHVMTTLSFTRLTMDVSERSVTGLLRFSFMTYPA